MPRPRTGGVIFLKSDTGRHYKTNKRTGRRERGDYMIRTNDLSLVEERTPGRRVAIHSKQRSQQAAVMRLSRQRRRRSERGKRWAGNKAKRNYL
jgi:hypothetical protein